MVLFYCLNFPKTRVIGFDIEKFLPATWLRALPATGYRLDLKTDFVRDMPVGASPPRVAGWDWKKSLPATSRRRLAGRALPAIQQFFAEGELPV